jgi:broad specificity phosphatase PhoE
MPGSPPSRIVLVRHGRSAHVATRWLDRDGVRAWHAAYDLAGLAPGERPPESLVALARGAGRIVASDLPRAASSARLLAGEGREPEPTPRLRETALETAERPLPRVFGLRLPLIAWAIVFGLRWLASRLLGTLPPGVDDAALRRADETAEWLAALARHDGTIVVVTHANFRAILVRALERRGWRGPERRPIGVWSAWEVEAEAP